MKILIIGGSGHVSGAVARAALARGDEVWTVTRGLRPLPEGVHALTADRADASALRGTVSGAGVEWDLVVDCICYRPEEMEQDVALFPDTAGQFVYVSTDFVFDPPKRQFPQPEDGATLTSDGPGSLGYGFRKRQCELKLMEADTGGMRWTIVRPCHIYGPTSKLGCLPLHGRDAELIERLRRGETLKLVGGGYFLQQPVLASDLAETILSVAGNACAFDNVFNVAGPDIIESWKYYDIVAELLGVELKVEAAPVRPFLAENPGLASDCCHRIYDRTKLRESGLAVPSTPIADGLRRHVEGLLGGGV